jgi:hypothetical protein
MADGDGDSLNVSGSLEGLTDADLTAAGITGGSSGGVLGNIGDWISNNPVSALGVAGGAGMLGYEMFGPPGAEQQDINQLQTATTGAGTMATALEAPLFSGTLPPGAQAALTTAQQNQTAQERSSYAKMGMAGSTGEADALRSVNQNIAAMKFNMETQMMDQASKYAGLQSSDLQNLLKDQMQYDQNFSNALSKFVSALAGGAGPAATNAAASTGPSLLSSIFGGSA